MWSGTVSVAFAVVGGYMSLRQCPVAPLVAFRSFDLGFSRYLDYEREGILRHQLTKSDSEI